MSVIRSLDVEEIGVDDVDLADRRFSHDLSSRLSQIEMRNLEVSSTSLESPSSISLRRRISKNLRNLISRNRIQRSQSERRAERPGNSLKFIQRLQHRSRSRTRTERSPPVDSMLERETQELSLYAQTSDSCQELEDRIAKRKHKEHINVYNRTIVDKDMNNIALILQFETYSKKLGFYSCLIPERSWKVFVDCLSAMEEKHQIITLDISGSSITENSWKFVAKVVEICRIENLIAQRCDIDAKQMKMFLDALCGEDDSVEHNLENLDISYNNDQGREMAEVISRFIRKDGRKGVKAVETGLEIWHQDVMSPAMIRNRDGCTITYYEDKVNCSIGVEGGVVDLTACGCVITIPSGAIDKVTELSFSLGRPMPCDSFTENRLPVSPIVRCLPSGILFKKSINVMVSTWIHSKHPDKNVKFEILSREVEVEEWKIEKEIKQGIADFVEFETIHFSDFAVVMDMSNTSEVEGNYCNMLFLPQNDPLYYSSQVLSSWFVPNNPVMKETMKQMRQNEGSKLYPGGEVPVKVTSQSQFFISLKPYESDNQSIKIVPWQPRQCTGTGILSDNVTRIAFSVNLASRKNPDEEVIVDLCHRISRNVGQDVEDPVTLRWRPRGEVAERHQHNYYNSYHLGDGPVNIFHGTKVVKQLVSSTVAPVEGENETVSDEKPTSSSTQAREGESKNEQGTSS